MRNFQAPPTLNLCKLWQQNTCTGFSFWIKLQAGALHLYLNEGPVQVPSCKFCLVSQNTYLQNIWERLFLLFFLKFYFLVSEELRDNEDWMSRNC